jgi:predicted site-specific integrase-resolvase
MLTPEIALTPCGYAIVEVERILGIPTKTGYRLVKERKLNPFLDSANKLKISREELYSHMKATGELG